MDIVIGLPWIRMAAMGTPLMWVFFVAFNILEASLPSLISRAAPPRAKGAALGVYSMCQALGLFTGGAVGGMLAQHVGAGGVFAFCAAIAVVWPLIAASMRPPLVSRVWAIPGRSLNS
jgi:predicted MFS family arabinose efflux permease